MECLMGLAADDIRKRSAKHSRHVGGAPASYWLGPRVNLEFRGGPHLGGGPGVQGRFPVVAP